VVILCFKDKTQKITLCQDFNLSKASQILFCSFVHYKAAYFRPIEQIVRP
jgi:hypothetical protein